MILNYNGIPIKVISPTKDAPKNAHKLYNTLIEKYEEMPDKKDAQIRVLFYRNRFQVYLIKYPYGIDNDFKLSNYNKTYEQFEEIINIAVNAYKFEKENFLYIDGNPLIFSKKILNNEVQLYNINGEPLEIIINENVEKDIRQHNTITMYNDKKQSTEPIYINHTPHIFYNKDKDDILYLQSDSILVKDYDYIFTIFTSANYTNIKLYNWSINFKVLPLYTLHLFINAIKSHIDEFKDIFDKSNKKHYYRELNSINISPQHKPEEILNMTLKLMKRIKLELI